MSLFFALTISSRPEPASAQTLAAPSPGPSSCANADPHEALASIQDWAAQLHYDEALSCAEIWIEHFPANRDFRFARIRLYAWKSDFNKARELMSLEKDKDPETHALRGEIGFMENDWKAASASFIKVLRATPRHSELHKQSRKRWIQSRLALGLSAEPWLSEAKADEPDNPEWKKTIPAAGRISLPTLRSDFQFMRANESQGWTEAGAAAEAEASWDSGLSLGIGARTKTRSSAPIAYSDKAFGAQAAMRWTRSLSTRLSFTQALEKFIYPANSQDFTAFWSLSNSWNLDFGMERRAYANQVTIDLFHGGGVYRAEKWLISLHGFKGIGTVPSEAGALGLRTLSWPWSIEAYGALGREESSRPYLQAGETIQGFSTLGLSVIWEPKANFLRSRFSCERRQEKAFWHHGCELGLGLTL